VGRTDSNFGRILRQNGLKNTKPRTAILDILNEYGQPLAAEELFSRLQDRGVPVNLSTVYRALDALCEKELVTKLTIKGDSRALYEYSGMMHRHHLICLGCKRITSIGRCPLEGYERRLASETDYIIEGHSLDVYGYCPECRNSGINV